MDNEGKRGVRRRLGPVLMSLAAAALTAVAFAAISVAKDDGGKSGEQGTSRAGAPGGPPAVFQQNLSDEDKQKLDDFRKCMEDNGAPAPPDPGEIDPSDGPPKPPSKADREKLDKAFEACKDQLPEDMQDGPHPGFGGPGCGPPPGAPPNQGEQQGQSQQGGSNQQGSYSGSSSSSGSAS